MSSLVKGLFGGVDDSGQKYQREANREAIDLIKANTKQARGDATRLFGEASQDRRGGYADALALFSETIPQQFSAIQQGRQNITDTLINGQSQIQNALLGRQTDLSGLRKDPLAIDMGFATRALPEIEYQQPQQPEVFDISQYLQGYHPSLRRFQ